MDLEFLESSSSSSSSDEEFLSSSDEEMYQEDRKRPKIYNDSEFIEHFRVSRHIAEELAVLYGASPEYNEQTGGNGKIIAYNQILIFLWFAGHRTASFRDVADRFGITISSLFRIVRRLTTVISGMANTLIVWPNEIEKQEIKKIFEQKGFPYVIGTIDGSHIRIDKPSTDPDSYYNRKKYFSIQMQAVCDHKKKNKKHIHRVSWVSPRC